MKLFITTLFILTLFISCSSDDPVEETFAEQIDGDWSGILTQTDCCTFLTTISINALSVGSTIDGAYTDSDYAICDDDIFPCEEFRNEPADCGFQWEVISISEPTLTLDEDADEFCADGFVTLRLLGNGNIQMDWRFSQNEPIEATGTLTKS